MSSPLSKKRNFFDLMEGDETEDYKKRASKIDIVVKKEGGKQATQIDMVDEKDKKRASEIVLVKKEGRKQAEQIDLVDEEDKKCAAQIDLVDEEDKKNAPEIVLVKKEGKKQAEQIDLVNEEDRKCATQIDLVQEEDGKQAPIDLVEKKRKKKKDKKSSAAKDVTEQRCERVVKMEQHLQAMMVAMEKLMIHSIACKEKSDFWCDEILEEAKKLKEANGFDANDDETVIESIVDQNYKSWRIMYGRLREYRIENGHANVPQQYAPNRKLGRWVTSQRIKFKEGSLHPDRFEKLNRLSFHWGKHSSHVVPSWNVMYQRLLAYRDRFGTCNIAGSSNSDGKPTGELAKWAAYQRMEYKRYKRGHGSLLTQDQIRRLDKIEFNWNGTRL